MNEIQMMNQEHQEPSLNTLNPGSLHSVFDPCVESSNEFIESIELWDETKEPDLLEYSHHELGVTAIINLYHTMFERSKLQLKLVDFDTNYTFYIDVTKEFKDKILRQMKYCLPGLCLNIDKCKHKYQSPSSSNSE